MVLLGRFKMVHAESVSFVLFQKAYNMPRFRSTKATKGEKEREKGKEGSVVSHRARLRREDETGGERLKTEGNGTSWPGGDDSISFSSSLLKPFERTSRERREIAGEREKVSRMSHAGLLRFLLLFPSSTTFLLPRKIYLLPF